VLSYSSEYRVDTTASAPTEPLALLESIARLTGGQSIGDAPPAAFAHDLDQQRAAEPVWPYLLLAATLLLPIDVAVRRLVLTRRDLAAARSRVFGAREALETRRRVRADWPVDGRQGPRSHACRPGHASATFARRRASPGPASSTASQSNASPRHAEGQSARKTRPIPGRRHAGVTLAGAAARQRRAQGRRELADAASLPPVLL